MKIIVEGLKSFKPQKTETTGEDTTKDNIVEAGKQIDKCQMSEYI